MDLFGDVSLGPFPLRFLAVAALLAAAILIARIPLRGHRRLRTLVTERLTNGVVIFVVAWKLAPALLDPLGFFRDPLSLLMGAPGIHGLILGTGAAAAYGALALVRPRRLRRASLMPLLLFAAVVAAGVGVEVVASHAAPPGPPAPALSLPTLDGRIVSLESFRGRVVVVNFWATWCPPCRAELPALNAFARRQGPSGTVLLLVDQTSSETSEEAVRAFVTKYGISVDVLLDGAGAVTRAWDVTAFPSTFVVSAGGLLSARRTGAVDRAWLYRQTAAAAAR